MLSTYLGPDALHVILRLRGREVRVVIPAGAEWVHRIDVKTWLEGYRR